MKSGYKFESKRRPNGQARQYQVQYQNAKNCALERNIDWQFTYESWIEWWGNDIVNRGPYKGQLVMARNEDSGPYHPDNVYKSITSDNCSLGSLGKPKKPESIAKLKKSLAKYHAKRKEALTQ